MLDPCCGSGTTLVAAAFAGRQSVGFDVSKQAVACASEIVESFGGAGYVEDTGIPKLLRDAQVLSIWEGTTNVLAVDAMKVMAQGPALVALVKLLDQISGRVAAAHRPLALQAVAAVRETMELLMKSAGDRDAVEAEARRIAFTLARATALALMVDHAADPRIAAAAQRFARAGLSRLRPPPTGESKTLLFG